VCDPGPLVISFTGPQPPLMIHWRERYPRLLDPKEARDENDRDAAIDSSASGRWQAWCSPRSRRSRRLRRRRAHRGCYWSRRLACLPQSDVTVRDSTLAMAMVRLAGDRSYFVPGEFRNGSYYEHKTFTSLPDRVLRMIKTSVQWWKIDVIDNAQAWLDNITFSEMMVKDFGRALVTNSICEGQTIHLGAVDNASVYFQDGEVRTHVSAWDRALMVLDGSLVDWRKGQFQYQTRNIAQSSAPRIERPKDRA
jgi:hypothetical protein